MKILLTGMTPVACGSDRRISDYVTFCTLLPKILREAGHDVVQRGVMVGEDLSEFDAAIIDVFNVTSMGTRTRRWGALWAAITLPHVVSFSDWQLTLIRKNLTPHHFWSVRLCGPNELAAREALLRYKDSVDGILASWPRHPTLLPSFTWGSHRFGCERFLSVDPSLWVPRLGEPAPNKKRYWVFASLTRHDKFLENLRAQWPIAAYVGENKVDEDFLVSKCYSLARGTLSHPYDISGSGWWRARFNYAEQTRTVVVQWDGCPLPAYGCSVAEVEALDDDGLARLAEAQSEQLLASLESRDSVLTRIQQFLTEVRFAKVA